MKTCTLSPTHILFVILFINPNICRIEPHYNRFGERLFIHFRCRKFFPVGIFPECIPLCILRSHVRKGGQCTSGLALMNPKYPLIENRVKIVNFNWYFFPTCRKHPAHNGLIGNIVCRVPAIWILPPRLRAIPDQVPRKGHRGYGINIRQIRHCQNQIICARFWEHKCCWRAWKLLVQATNPSRNRLEWVV